MKSGDVIMALKCPKCGAELILKNGIYGPFWACPNYPECKYIENVEIYNKSSTCPRCGNLLRLRHGIYGDFWSCSNYPKCTYTEDVEPSGSNSKRCPRCGSLLLIKNSMRHGLIYACQHCRYFRRA